jgi:hypothetical protein
MQFPSKKKQESEEHFRYVLKKNLNGNDVVVWLMYFWHNVPISDRLAGGEKFPVLIIVINPHITIIVKQRK